MKLLLASLAAVLLVGCGGGSGAGSATPRPTVPEPSPPTLPPFDPESALPDETVVFAHVSVDRFRQSSHWPRVMEWLDALGGERPDRSTHDATPADPDAAEEAVVPGQRSGVRGADAEAFEEFRLVLERIDEVWLSVSDQAAVPSARPGLGEREWPGGVLLIARGSNLETLNPERLLGISISRVVSTDQGERGSCGTHTASPNPEASVAVVDAHWVVGRQQDVCQALSRARAGVPLTERHRQAGALASRARQATAPLSAWVRDQPDALRALSTLLTLDGAGFQGQWQDGSFWLDATTDLVLEGVLGARTPRAATAAAGQLEGQRQQLLAEPFLRILGLHSVVASATVKSSGPRLVVRLALPEVEVVQLLDRLDGFREAIRAGGAPAIRFKAGRRM